MIALGIALSDAGVGDYWDDVDHIVRNQLVEQQFTDLERMRAINDHAVTAKPRQATDLAADATRNVIERTLGSFGGMAGPANMSDVSGFGCCTGNGSLALYAAWEGIVRFCDGLATVNLLLNRASPWVDVDSYLPFEGRVRITNKSAGSLAVRIPGWVELHRVRSSIDGEAVSPQNVGRYLLMHGLKPRQVIEMVFDVPRGQESYVVHGQSYTLTYRGSTVIDISPRDDSPWSYPLYKREALSGDRVPMKTADRYVASSADEQ